MANVFAVGVGPGSPDCITAKVEKIIRDCDVVIGYQYTLDTIKHLLVDKETVIITMSNQEEAYQRAKETLGNKTLVIPFTGDVNFSESEEDPLCADCGGKNISQFTQLPFVVD